MNNMKPGYQTTEFWIAIAPWILAMLITGGVLAGSISMSEAWPVLTALGIGGGVSSAGYSGARARVKGK